MKCTHIEIPQTLRTFATVLSKPSWMWGAEMGANEAGVVIGNEAVWDRLSDDTNDLVPRFLGMDLLRLGLERGGSATEALEVIVGLLEEYGQGGQCSDIIPDFSYHNSFLIADRSHAWILETADRLWVAEEVRSGYRNISNDMSITTTIDRCSVSLKETALSKGWWDGSSVFNWSSIIQGGAGNDDPRSRYACGRRLLAEKSRGGKFNVKDMMAVLRDEDSGINMTAGGSFMTTGSQVSVLAKPDATTTTDFHLFTGTPVPPMSVFKPFVFCNDVGGGMGECTVSPVGASLPPLEREHSLWKAHRVREWNSSLKERLSCLEEKYVELAQKKRSDDVQDCDGCLFGKAVKEEMELYA